MSGSFFHPRSMIWQCLYGFALIIFLEHLGVRCCNQKEQFGISIGDISSCCPKACTCTFFQRVNCSKLEINNVTSNIIPVFSGVIRELRLDSRSIGDISSWCPKACNCTFFQRVNCSKLEINNVTFNMIPVFSGVIRELRLDSSNIETLDANIFNKLENLRILNLSNNNLETLDPFLFSKLFNLEVLDLSYNKLNSDLDNRLFQELRVLKYLNIAFNNITTMNVSLLTPLVSVKTLVLSGNSFDCDCDLQNVVVWSRNKRLHTQATCNGTGERWEDLTFLPNCLNLTITDTSPINISDNLDKTTEKSFHDDTDTTENAFPIVTVLVVVICIMAAMMCLGISLHCWKHAKRSESHNDVQRQNIMTIYDDIRSAEYYYYEYIRTRNTRSLSTTFRPGSVPDLPERLGPNIGQGIFKDIRNSETVLAVSTDGTSSKMGSSCDSYSYVQPDTSMFRK